MSDDELICGCGHKIIIEKRNRPNGTVLFIGHCINLRCPLNYCRKKEFNTEAEAAFKLATRAEINLPERK